MRVFGVYGLHCERDLHQTMMQASFDYKGESDSLYQSMSVSPMSFTGAVESANQADFGGIHILWPFQEYVTEIVDECSELVEKAFCANMLVCSGGMISAFNTIGPGMMNALTKEKNYSVADKKVLLIGAGAAARTFAVMFAQAGAAEIMMANRTKERAVKNAAELTEKLGKEIKSCGWEDDGLAEYMKDADLVINCTFLGSWQGGKDEMPLPEMLDNLHAGQLVVDVTVDPAETPFLKKAKEQGADTMPGYLILLHEGVESYKMWFNVQTAPTSFMRKALEDKVL